MGVDARNAELAYSQNMRLASVLCMGLTIATCFGQGTILFEADHPHFGSKSLTVDPRTGLAFLDATKSLNLSIGKIQQEMQPGGVFFGFRHATSDEVRSLYVTAGITTPNVPAGTPEFGNVLRLIEMVGKTYDMYGYPALSAVKANRGTTLMLYSVTTGGYYVSDPSAAAIVIGNDVYSSPGLGHWLVVPEPTALNLLAIVFSCTVFKLHFRGFKS
jgi:hypothetical protein